MIRLVLMVAMITAAPMSAAFACPPPRNDAMRERLELLTPSGTVLPEDGGLVVRRTTVDDGQPGDTLRVQTADGTEVRADVTAYADGVERWTLPPGDRELQVVDATGKVVRTFRQSRARPRRPPGLPRIKRLSARAAVPMRGPGVPASAMRLDLSAAPPPDTVLILGELVRGTDTMPWLTLAPAGTRYDRETYAHKGCSPGPAPVTAPAKLRFRYLAADGRLSAPSRTVATSRLR